MYTLQGYFSTINVSDMLILKWITQKESKTTVKFDRVTAANQSSGILKFRNKFKRRKKSFQKEKIRPFFIPFLTLGNNERIRRS